MKKRLTILITMMLCIATVFTVGCTADSSLSKDPNTNTGSQVQSVRMAMGAPFTITAPDGTQYIEKTLTAMVLPSTATNRKVDFAVEWGAEAIRSSELVSDYITVVQETDGSTTGKVRCFKSFGDDKILIRVVTRDGRLTDTCTISFVGFCSDIELDTSSLEKNDLSTTDHVGEYILYSNKSYTIPILATNIFDDVGDSSLKIKEYGWRGIIWIMAIAPVPCSLENYDGYKQMFDVTIDLEKKNLVITINEYSLSQNAEFVLSTTEGRGLFVKADSDTPPYLFVIVEDELTGVTQELRFWIEASVDSVSLDNKTMTFNTNEIY